MVEVIGSSPTAPTNEKRHAKLRVFSHWWGRKGRVRGINDTRCFFTTQNAVGRQFALANSCRRTPACGKRQSLYRPTPSTKAKIGCPFSMWWGRTRHKRYYLFFSKLKMPSVVNLPWQILAVGLPLAGNGKASTAHTFNLPNSACLFLLVGA